MNSEDPSASISSSHRVFFKKSVRSTIITLASLFTCHAQTAGIDFDSGGPFTETGFLSVPATGSKDYNVTHNGVTFDIVGSSVLGNQNRLRASGADVNNDLTRDFIQWYSSNDGSVIPEAAITLSGLEPTSEYQLSFFHYNAGAFQQPHSVYDGTSATGIFLGTVTVSKTVPNADYTVASSSNGEILVTVTGNNGRLTLNGMRVTYLGPAIAPQPLEITQLLYNDETKEFEISWKSNPGETYGLYWSEDLENFQTNINPAIPAAEGEIITTFGPFVSPVADPTKLFFRIGPPDFLDPILSNVVGNQNTITMTFSEAMASGPATDLSNYTVNLDGGGQIGLSSANLNEDGTKVTLTTATSLGAGMSYFVDFQNLTDLAGRSLPTSNATFATWDNAPNGIKVFILAGQSNMQGHGWHDDRTPDNGIDEDGTIRKMIEGEPNGAYDYLLDGGGNWITRSDVHIFTIDGSRSGGLSVGYGVDSSKTGPEFGFGWQVGEAIGEDVLIIKTCWGGKSLLTDFRPPSAVQKRGGEVGFYYEEMFTVLREVLGDIGTYVPGYAGQGYEFKGFGWHQGWNDRVNQTAVDEYEENLVDFINDVRSELGVGELPFVVANTGIGGPSESNTRALALMEAQLNVGNATLYPAFAGNVASIDTRTFWRDASVSPITSGNQGFHWNQNGETMFLIGDAMGEKMIDLIPAP